jgi:hypothetical protein
MAAERRGKPATVNANAAETSSRRYGACPPQSGWWKTGRAAPQSLRGAVKGARDGKSDDETGYTVSSLRTNARD